MKKRISIRRIGFMTFVHMAGNKLQRIARRSHFLFCWSSADRNSIHVSGHTILVSFLSNGNGVQSTHGWNETSTSSDFPVLVARPGSWQSAKMPWAMEKPLSNWGWYTDVRWLTTTRQWLWSRNSRPAISSETVYHSANRLQGLNLRPTDPGKGPVVVQGETTLVWGFGHGGKRVGVVCRLVWARLLQEVTGQKSTGPKQWCWPRPARRLVCVVRHWSRQLPLGVPLLPRA